jgi:ligand-binding SRPBCC domain-containing protein
MIEITKSDKLWSYSLKAEQVIDAALSTVFPFFADARNLEKLTPDIMHFSILSMPSEALRSGSRITYRIRLKGIPLRWHTRIEDWTPPHSFVDRQIFGPFLHWHHTHSFEEVDGKTLVKDIVNYTVPGGPLLHQWFIKKDLHHIFSYRQKILTELFPPNR